MEGSQGDGDNVQIHRGAENHMEGPQGDGVMYKSRKLEKTACNC